MIAHRDGTCDEGRIRQLIEDQLSEAEAERLGEHLDRCPACQQKVETLAESDDLTDRLRGIVQAAPIDRSPLSTSAIPAVSSRETIPDLSGYEIRGRIGRGAAGTVYSAVDTTLHRSVAVKVLHPHLCDCPAARTRFVREARAAAALVHPNVVPIFAIEPDEASPAIVMPLVDGGSLQQRIERDGPLGIEDVLRIAAQIADGLAAAHAVGIIHRDIKPANILLDRGGHRAQIADFGIARAVDQSTMTASGLIAGTPSYMSPEQAGGLDIDARSDLFSLGSLMFATATGREPYRGDSSLAVLRRVADQPPPRPSGIDETLPPWFDRLLGRFHERDPDRRISSAASAAELIRNTLAHVRDPARTPLPDELTSPVPARRWAGLVAGGGLVLATGMALGAWLFQPETDAVPSESPAGVAVERPASTGSIASPPTGGISDEFLERELRMIEMQIDALEREFKFW